MRSAPKLFKITFVKSWRNYRQLEGAGFALPDAVELIATGIARIAPDEAERDALVAAVKAYRVPKPQAWQRYLLQPSWFKFNR